MIVQACLNGAAELHIHVRGDDGRETLRPEIVDITIEKLRRACPGTPIGISTGEWIEKDDGRRRAFIRNWSVLPDYASVNLVEADCAAVIAELEKRGIAIELGIWTAADAARCREWNLAARALRLLFEIFQQDRAEALAEFAAIEKSLAQVARLKPVLLHGFDATVWTFVRAAFARGYATRVGLEDGCALPDGRLAPSNAALVSAALELKRTAAKSGG